MPAARRTDEVSEFIAASTHPLKDGMAALREIILGADRGISEHIKWNAPSFCFDGEDRVTLNLSRKDRIVVVFHGGAKTKRAKGFQFKDPSGLMEWKGADRAVMQFLSAADIKQKRSAIGKAVRDWVNAAA